MGPPLFFRTYARSSVLLINDLVKESRAFVLFFSFILLAPLVHFDRPKLMEADARTRTHVFYGVKLIRIYNYITGRERSRRKKPIAVIVGELPAE